MTAHGSTDVNSPSTGDPVHHPPHYNTHPSGIECVEFSELLPGNLSHVCVYVWRHEHKGTPAQDLEKALWFLRRERARGDLERHEMTKLYFTDEGLPTPLCIRMNDRLRPLRRFADKKDFVADCIVALCELELELVESMLVARHAELTAAK